MTRICTCRPRATRRNWSCGRPGIVADAGDRAARRFLEFFAATIRNKNTRMAYYRACCSFFAWLEQRSIAELVDIEPLHVAAYIEALQDNRRQADRQAAPRRDPHAVRLAGRRPGARGQSGACGARTQVCRQARQDAGADDEEARRLIDSIDISTLVGLRDRALIGVMTYAFARIGAVVAMRVEDYYPNGKRWWVRLHEKGGKRHEMPAHHCQSARKRGSVANLVQRSGFSWCAEQAGTEQIELGPAVHLALDQLQLGVLSFCLSVRPWLDKRGLYCGAIIDDAGRG